MNIYVGNLNFSTTEDEIRDLFEPFGSVTTVKMITDRETGRPRGFGFVEMEGDGGDTAIEALNGKEIKGRNIQVNEARQRTERAPRRFVRR